MVASPRAGPRRRCFTPERVIESRQVQDGRTIYELFAPGKPKEPAMEIAWQDGKATLLTQRAVH